MNKKDIKIIRDLAKRVKAAADDPRQEEQRELWRQHNSLQSLHPLISIYPEGSWQELIPASALNCEDSDFRNIEEALLQTLYYHETMSDDQPVEALWEVPKKIESSGWGIEGREINSSDSRGAWHFDPVIFDAKDLNKIKSPIIHFNEEETEHNRIMMENLFDGILPVQVKGVNRIDYHLLSQYTKWRGLEEVMMDMFLNPEMLHDAMSILCEGHKQILRQYLEQDLLELNNDGTYHSSGGNGYLPVENSASKPSDKVLPIHLWASSESQELAQVGPEQHAEFALPYEKELLKPFALSGYGCCEDLSNKMDDVFEIENLRRISISPWADVKSCAEQLKGDYIYSWKPQPANLVGEFQPELVRSYLRNTVETALEHGCVLEIVLKDTHTCQNHPERFTQWLKIAREEVSLAMDKYGI
ncbi:MULTISPECIES: hypothetical protein [unclassified Oceanispirochaeta]|uniref:hypothetical protein n=1 Tax=unclassified Oceanispirochaeta TaxID=2635722 RepID=UPI000E0929E4|nr:MULTISPECIES: hypothetical protein [unclassified Oceanispirochaeta]MBF9018925.1 hypothetical protein [Oceanispirochaeta sp. M2]NPD75424.1 hypothetical protein [Oceanispirochaeta sp. M1]RDG28724.1 hypothetical protein DV872_25360 [Oceanispirochaeta sp. M1]